MSASQSFRWAVWSCFAATLLTGAAAQSIAPACTTPGAQTQDIAKFVRAGCHLRWQQQPRHLSGSKVDDKFYTVHQDIEVFFSPEVGRWLDGSADTIQNGAMVVALERPHGQPDAKPQTALVKVLAQGSSVDGWYWSTVPLAGGGAASGEFGNSTCLSCHATAKNVSTFLAPGPPADATAWRPDPTFIFPDAPPVDRTLPAPLDRPDQAFLTTYGIAEELDAPKPFPPRATDHVPARGVQQFMTSDQCRGCHNASQRLSNSRPNLWYPNPNSSDPTYRNYSPYGEWAASIHSLAARDPIFHAEMEAEIAATPAIKGFVYDVCLSCHAPMAGRQLKIDTGDSGARFGLSMLLAHKPQDPKSTYGALGRDGVSCAFCHRATNALLGVDLPPGISTDTTTLNETEPFNPHTGFGVFVRPSSVGSYNAQLQIDTNGRIFGPYDKVNGSAEKNATGFAPVGGADAKQVGEAALCGSCHTVIVPAVPRGYAGNNPGSDKSLPLGFEQTTYWEWRNSFWENEAKGGGLPCQGCHMAPNRGADGRLIAGRIANIESDRFPPVNGRLPDKQIHLAKQFPVPRHTFVGINLFVLEMFKQFPETLGSRAVDPTVPKQTLDPLLNASDWESEHAAHDTLLVNVTELRNKTGKNGDMLEFDVQVANYAGHKFPTGYATRRAFVEVTVLDENNRVLWSSGTTNSVGVIVDGATGEVLPSEWTRQPGESQPHHAVIDRQDKVQIYEQRTTDEKGKLQSRVLGVFDVYKDNRILPMGWAVEAAKGGGALQIDRRFPLKGSVNMFAIHPVLPGSDGSDVPKTGVLGTPVPDYCAKPKEGAGYDPYYCDPAFTQFGADVVTYRVPVDKIDGWACVQARALYQSVPPYYMKDLIGGSNPGPAAKRLAYIASRMNWEDSAIKNWALQVGNLASVDRLGKPELSPALRRCGSQAGRGVKKTQATPEGAS
jgi:hypothetical protein